MLPFIICSKYGTNLWKIWWKFGISWNSYTNDYLLSVKLKSRISKKNMVHSWCYLTKHGRNIAASSCCFFFLLSFSNRNPATWKYQMLVSGIRVGEEGVQCYYQLLAPTKFCWMSENFCQHITGLSHKAGLYFQFVMPCKALRSVYGHALLLQANRGHSSELISAQLS